MRRRLNSRNTVVRDAGDLTDSLADRLPLHAERLGEGVAELGLVQEPGGARVGVQVPAVERSPHAVFAEGRVRDHDVGVELRVTGPARPVAERGGDQPVTVEGLDAVVAAPATGSPRRST